MASREDAVLHTTISDEVVPQEVTGKNDYTVYQVSLENTTVTGADTLAVRLLNPYKKATVWSYLDGENGSEVDSKVRGQYLQTAMKGAIGTFCIVEESSNTMKIIIIIAVCAAVVVLLLLLIRKLAGRHRNKEKKPQET